MGLTARVSTVVATALLACTSASAQVRCTMPNGVVIEQKLSNRCPVGAVKGETFDGKAIAIQLPPSAPPSVPSAPAREVERQAPAPAPAATAYDDARAICAMMLSTGIATSCEVDSNIFSTSVIDATVPGGAGVANRACQDIKIAFRKMDRPITRRDEDWEIRFFSPYGNGSRPMFRCVL